MCTLERIWSIHTVHLPDMRRLLSPLGIYFSCSNPYTLAHRAPLHHRELWPGNRKEHIL